MSSLNKKLRNQDGFTLLEVILSIGALAILSVFILQMFIVSANANKRAQDMDMASALAMSKLDEIALADSYDDYFEASMSTGVWGEEIVQSTLSSQAVEYPPYGTISYVYDENWNDISEQFDSPLDFNNNDSLTDTDARYVMYVDVQENDSTVGLVDITITVQSVNNMTAFYSDDTSTTRTLVEYSTSKYFPTEGETVIVSYDDTPSSEDADNAEVATVLVQIELEKIEAASTYYDYIWSNNTIASEEILASSNSMPDGTYLVAYDKDWQDITEDLDIIIYDPDGDNFSGTDACYAMYIDIRSSSEISDEGQSKEITVSIWNVESDELLVMESIDKYFVY